MEFRARKALGQRVRMLRNAYGWSQEVLAYLSGLNRSYIGAIERSEHNIGLDNIEKISSALEVSVADLVNALQTRKVSVILGNNDKTESIDTTPSLPMNGSPATVTVNRQTMIQLIKHCDDHGYDSVFNYLQLRGMHVTD